MTKLVDMSGNENVIQDSWDDNWTCKKGKDWTGKTICHIILPEGRRKKEDPEDCICDDGFDRIPGRTNVNGNKECQEESSWQGRFQQELARSANRNR